MQSIAMTFVPAMAEAAQSPLEQLGLHVGLGYGDVESNLLRANRDGDVAHRSIAFYLNELHERRLYQQSGHSSAVHWATNRLGMCERTARELIITGRRLLELQEIDAEFAAGWLSWSKVRRLASKATVETQREWIDLARQLTCRELEIQLLRSQDGKPPRGERLGIGQIRFKVQASIDTLTYEEWELAKRKLSDEIGQPIGDGELMREAARLILSTSADGSVAGRRPVQESHYKIVLRCDPGRGTAEVVTEAGPVPVPSASVSLLLCEGATLESEPATDRGTEPGSVSESESAPASDLQSSNKPPPTSASLRRAILARDGHRCHSCGRRMDLHVHHKTWREHGGPTVPANLLSVCRLCHGLVHEGFLNIEGEVPDRLRFLDVQGLPIERWLNVARSATAATPQPLREPVTEAPRCLPPQIVRIDDVPDHVGAEWWQRHQNLVPWNERRGVLEFHEGMPVDTAHVRHLSSDNAPDMAHVRHAPSEDLADRDASSCRLTDLVGQARAVSALKVAVLAARLESRPLPHVLLSGPPGVGKTTLARALANEMGARLSTIAAPLLDDVPKMVAMLVSLEPGQVLFIDEVHALPRPVAEVLYEALENRRLPLPLVCGTQRRTLVVGLAPFTCIGATTDEGAVPEALRARFPLRESLELLAECEVAESLRRAAARSGVELADAAADTLAKAAHGTPREGLALLGRARDEMLASGGIMIDEACATRALERAGIDARGLGPVERKILELLNDDRSHSLARIAAHVSLPPSTVSRVHEPKLLRLGLIRIGPYGRVAGKGPRATPVSVSVESKLCTAGLQ